MFANSNNYESTTDHDVFAFSDDVRKATQATLAIIKCKKNLHKNHFHTQNRP